MKLCYILYMAWWFLHAVQSASLEENMKESENAIIEEQAFETPDLEMLPMKESVKDAEEQAPAPSGRLAFWEDGITSLIPSFEERPIPVINASDICGSTSNNDFSRWNNDARILAISPRHRTCGPYTTHYSNAQCPIVCHRYGITVRKCEDICRVAPNCTAFNWSGNGRLGCVMRDCGAGTPPYPTGTTHSQDWYSFSFIKPDEIPHCQLPNRGLITWPADTTI